MFLTWDASPATDITNYTVYLGTSSSDYTTLVQAGPVTHVTITNLVPGLTYFLAVTASDSSGIESEYSNEITFSVPAGRPAPGPGQPELTLIRSGAVSVLRWSTNYAGFTLQWSTSVAGEWTDLAANPSISGSDFVCTNRADAAQAYYRLRQ